MDDKRGPLAFSFAMDRDCAAMGFDNVVNDGQAESQTPMFTRFRRVGLSEALEKEGNEFGIDPFAGVGDADLYLRSQAVAYDSDFSAPVREFNGIRQQIPKDLLKSVRIGEDLFRDIRN